MNTLSDAEVEGRRLAQQLLERQCPAESFTNTGVLHIRDAKAGRTNILVKFATIVTETNWLKINDIEGTNDAIWRLTLAHNGTNFTQYEMSAWDKKSHSRMKLAVPINDWQMVT